MNNLVIISAYDGRVYEIMLDNTIFNNEYTITNVVDSHYKTNYLGNLDEKFINWLKENFKNKTIIICDDGGIYKYES